ncbi:MAG: hypothetical protein M4579_003678 [Chaenotheca gracillima]|nr:MAG: hypothetical protein M4579_003678 [Chaenotheca gracillima]
MAPNLTESQARHIMLVERLSSALSLIGCLWIIITFCSSKAFRKPIARLIMYATFGNIIVSVASFISQDGMVGGNTGLCKTQAFMIQVFLPADLLWALASAVNVYLTFKKRWNADDLKALEWKYVLLCYGTPLIPAVIYFFIHSKNGTPVYGPAEIWCWITFEWRILRVAQVYGPIWLAVIGIFFCYGSVGHDILETRRIVKSFAERIPSALDEALKDQTGKPRTFIFKSSDDKGNPLPVPVTAPTPGPETWRQSIASVLSGKNKTSTGEEDRPLYSVSAAATGPSAANRLNLKANERAVDLEYKVPGKGPTSPALCYARTAGLLALGIFFTWVPSSIFRIYALERPDNVVYPLQVVSAIALPLQGFWNALVYTSATQDASKQFILDAKNFVLKLFHRKKTPDAATGSAEIPTLARPGSVLPHSYLPSIPALGNLSFYFPGNANPSRRAALRARLSTALGRKRNSEDATQMEELRRVDTHQTSTRTTPSNASLEWLAPPPAIPPRSSSRNNRHSRSPLRFGSKEVIVEAVDEN